MTREWKPGDVVTGLLDGIEIVGIVRGGGRRMFYADSVTTDQVDLKHVRNLRPLVVIDPEDREQAEGFTVTLGREFERRGRANQSTPDPDVVAATQAALREFANPTPPTPPRPEEPTGLGAVVEDAEGARWVRAGVSHRKSDDWRCVEGGTVGYWSPWANVKAVRVLSEGAKP